MLQALPHSGGREMQAVRNDGAWEAFVEIALHRLPQPQRQVCQGLLDHLAEFLAQRCRFDGLLHRPPVTRSPLRQGGDTAYHGVLPRPGAVQVDTLVMHNTAEPLVHVVNPCGRGGDSTPGVETGLTQGIFSLRLVLAHPPGTPAGERCRGHRLLERLEGSSMVRVSIPLRVHSLLLAERLWRLVGLWCTATRTPCHQVRGRCQGVSVLSMLGRIQGSGCLPLADSSAPCCNRPTELPRALGQNDGTGGSTPLLDTLPGGDYLGSMLGRITLPLNVSG